MTDFTTYQSPFSWRYSSNEMRRLWSEHNKRLLWRQMWVALAETEAEFGLVTRDQCNDLHDHMNEIDIQRATELEAELHHDLMAEVCTFAEQAPIGGGIIHLGATSMDIEDNADALRIRQSLDLTLTRLTQLLRTIGELTDKWADIPLIAFTHIQPAIPSTFGYRLAQYAQDLLEDYKRLKNERNEIRGKGFKGAVGTGASYSELIGVNKLTSFEKILSRRLDLPFFPVATQTYPRKQDYNVLSALAGLGQSLYKLAFDLRILQSPPIGELAEPNGHRQVGSSAMPFKRNPINAEKIDSLARYLAQLPRVAWDNAANSILERTLDDSANRRTILPEAFLAADEMLLVANKILSGLRLDEKAMARNLDTYGPFAATERVLMAAVKAGADRQDIHECIRKQSMIAWEAVINGQINPLTKSMCRNKEILDFLHKDEILELMDHRAYVGNAPQLARQMAKTVLQEVGDVSIKSSIKTLPYEDDASTEMEKVIKSKNIHVEHTASDKLVKVGE